MRKFEIVTLCDAVLTERWLVTAASPEDAERALLEGCEEGEDIEILSETSDHEENREVLRVEELTNG